MSPLPNQDLVTSLMRFAMALPSETEWVARRIEVKPVAAGVEMDFTESDGQRQYGGSAMMPDEESRLVLKLQKEMYDREHGTWVSAHFDVNADGSGDARFNYDEPPQVIVTGPGLDPVDAAAHLRRYPRSAGAPSWLSGAADQAPTPTRGWPFRRGH